VYYREILRVRRNLAIFLGILAGLLVLQIISNISQHGSLVRVTITPDVATHTRLPLSLLFAIAGIVTTIFGGVLGTSLSCENTGHLALAWTKPASRNRYALTVMAVDAVAMLAAFGLTLVTTLAIVAFAAYASRLFVDGDALRNLARFLAIPFAWYALMQTLTASLRERGGLVAGLSWIVSLILLALGTAQFPPLWSHLITFANYFNPIAYAAYSTPQDQAPYPFVPWEFDLVALFALTVLGVIAALAQWRRLEA
jgi:hypothetical protein